MSDAGKSKSFTFEEVSKHRSVEDCWIILGDEGEKKVYDITEFLDDHPGGPEILLDVAKNSQDAQDEFEDIGHSMDALKMLPGLCIGTLEESKVSKPAAPAKATEPTAKKSHKIEQHSNGINFWVALGAFILVFVAWLFKPVE